jgi:hypothetical protein
VPHELLLSPEGKAGKKARMRELEVEVDAHTRQRAQLEAQLARRAEQAAEMEQAMGVLSQENSVVEQTLGKERMLAAKFKEVAKQLQAERKQLQAEKGELERKVAAGTRDTTKLQRQHEALSQSQQEALQRAASAKSELREADAAKVQLEAHLGKATRELGAARAGLEGQAAELKTAKREGTVARLELSELTRTVEAERKAMAAKRQQLERRVGEASTSEQKAATAAAEAASADEDQKAAMQALRTNVKALDLELANARSLAAQKDLALMEASPERLKELAAEKARAQSQAETARARADELAADLCQAEARARGAAQAWDDERGELQRSGEQLAAAAQSEFALMRAEADAMYERAKAAEAAVEARRSETERLALEDAPDAPPPARVAELEAELDSSRTALADAEHQRKERTSRLREKTQAYIAQLTGQHKQALDAQRAQADARLAGKEAELDALRATASREIAAVQRQLSAGGRAAQQGQLAAGAVVAAAAAALAVELRLVEGQLASTAVEVCTVDRPAILAAGHKEAPKVSCPPLSPLTPPSAQQPLSRRHPVPVELASAHEATEMRLMELEARDNAHTEALEAALDGAHRHARMGGSCVRAW